MRNNTPGCDRQNESLAAHAAEFDRAGYNLIAVSRDTLGSHAKYAAKKKITYTLASDPDDQFARAADAVVEKSMYGRKFKGPARAAFVLDRDATVLAVAEKVDTADHAAQLRKLVATLK
jgi:peroxiredoxin Q/BCP